MSMTIGDFFRKIFMVDLFAGMSITFREMLSGAITEQYPKQRGHIFPRFRGEPRMGVTPEGKTLCIACNLCAQACPENCITVSREKDPETKKFVLTGYTLDLRRCLFCGFCQEVCPVDCITLSTSYELAQYDIAKLVLDLPTLEKGVEKTIYRK